MAIVQTDLFNLGYIEIVDNSSEIIKKTKAPKKKAELSVDKMLKSKDVSFKEKLNIVTENVNRILGKYKDDTIVISNYLQFVYYIDKCLSNGVVAVDTETIGTRDDIDKPATDPFTCKMAGLCLYTPDMKAAYIPINHCDWETKERLNYQLTESQISEQLKRLTNIDCIFHNGKFDYMVIWFTCGVKLPITWDTMIGAQILNENEMAALKFQYSDKIDPDQEKYNIDSLFNVEMFPYYPPELFALYAAQDSMYTYRLYQYQKEQFSKPGNERLYSLFLNIEMKVVTVVSEMQIRGVGIDNEFATRLSNKFHNKLDEVNSLISEEMSKYEDIISEWRLTPEANFHPTNNGKKQKSLSEKLSDPIELTSPTQLGIFFYDVLKVLKLSKDQKKVVDEDTLKSISDKLPLINLLLKKREYEKYLGTYIDAIPQLASPRDGRIHPKFNQLGREEKNVVTGRFSSTDPNFQNIPARGDITSVRCMFIPTTEYENFEKENNFYLIPVENEVLLDNGNYKWSSYLEENDILEDGEVVDHIEILNSTVKIYIK